uniref:Ig-like domain-containing protein n=1 Tax=Amazona collaria TaxID=241587 RepID=A0A8B9EWL2_9PSIT
MPSAGGGSAGEERCWGVHLRGCWPETDLQDQCHRWEKIVWPASYFQETLIFSLFSEPEVVFTNKEKVQKEVKAALSENAMLSCEVAQEKTDVKWYKEGKLITSSKKFKVESEGKCRRLVVCQLEKKDAGEYTCEAAGQKLTFRINVTGKRRFFGPSFPFQGYLEKLVLFHEFFSFTLHFFGDHHWMV